MKNVLIFLILLLCCNLKTVIAADTQATLNELLPIATNKKLAEDPFWLALLKYKGTGEQNRSEILSPEFFLAKDGAVNPRSELQETLKAFYSSNIGNPNEHAQCRFPARLQWLRQTLNIKTETLPVVNCTDYNEWTLNNSVESISLIFATGYLGNPASFYGHILLKFNSSQKHLGSQLLDQSVNYGAIIPDNEPGLIYITKGIFGGYVASFSSAKFYRHNHNYGENELRDMWDYELNLNRQEIDFLVAHSWELLGKHYVYYFFNENCAFRMAELLNMLVDSPLLPETFWSQPSSLFDYIITTTHNNKPLVKTVSIIPSRQNRFYESYLALSDHLKSILNTLVDNKLNFNNVEYQNLTAIDKISIVNVLLDYTEFRIANEKDTESFKESKKALLLERLKLPVEKETKKPASTSKKPPHFGPLPNLVRTSALHNSKFGNGVMLQLRPTYFDFLALDAGRLANSNLSMMDLKLVYLNDKESIRSLDFVHVESLNVSRTGLPGDGGFAWKIKFGLESLDLGCDDCLVFSAQGGVGKAHPVTDNSVLHYLLELKAHTNHRNVGNTVNTAKVGIIVKPVDGWKTLFYLGNQQYLDGTETSSRLVTFENRFGNNRNWDIRFTYHKKVESEYSLGISFYW